MATALKSPGQDLGVPVAPTLSEVQAAFQRAVMHGDDAVLNEILDNSRTNRGVLLGVYRHAYVARLIEVVRNDHPFLNRLLGDAELSDLARAYIAASPSRNRNARWFSHGFPDFIAKTHPDQLHVAELAALERALNDAFDAPDAEPLALADLAAVPPELWSNLVFTPHPSAARLTLTTNAHSLWLALKDEKAPPEVETFETPETVLVWRREATPRLRRASGEEAMMWTEAAKGLSFGALCELVATYDDPDTAPLRAAQYLQGWITSGLLAKTAPEE